MKKRITSIKNEKNEIINYNRLSSALKEGFKENFNFELIDDSLTNEEIKLAKKLRQEKYSTEKWNLGLKQENLI